MYFSVFCGHAESSWPSLSGMPTVCMHGTKKPSLPSRFSAGLPMRVMMNALMHTYALSVSSTPTAEYGLSTGPMQYGTAYMVRPFMQLQRAGWSGVGWWAVRGR